MQATTGMTATTGPPTQQKRHKRRDPYKNNHVDNSMQVEASNIKQVRQQQQHELTIRTLATVG
jgi:hypothetical protein